MSTIAVLAMSVFFYMLIGRDSASIWPANAVHNWEQYGFVALHGKLVTNPGGFEVLEHPDIYKGHRPAAYYPVLLVSKLFGWLADGLLIYHAIFSVALFFSIWFLLGRSPLAAVGGLAAALCPGYSVYPTVVDPNAMALYMVVPFAAVTIHLLSAKELPPQRLALLALATFAYTSMNWSTVLGHGILFCALLALPAVSWSRLGIYAALSGVSVGIVGTISVIDKMGGGGAAAAAGGGGFKTFLLGYTWGSIGYGADLNTMKALVRLTVVNVMGQLPLLGFLGWLAWKSRSGSRRGLVAFLPLAAACLGILTLRNYFGHHPWMAAPLLLPALVFSIALMVRRGEAAVVLARPWLAALFIAGAFLYSLTVLAVHRGYHSEALELASFVRQHTARTDTIVLAQSLDPQMAAQAESVSETCDRHVVLLPDLAAPPALDGNCFLLSSADLGGQLSVVAKSEKPALVSHPLFRHLMAWYRQHVSRRGEQDRHFEFAADASFVLYHLPPAR